MILNDYFPEIGFFPPPDKVLKKSTDMPNRIEHPGAMTPWPSINQILKGGERFSVHQSNTGGYLFAPDHPATLSALLYTLHRENIAYSVEGTIERVAAESSHPRVFVSVRAINEVAFPDRGIVKVGAGCDLQTLHDILYEAGYESGFTGSLFNDRETIGEALKRGYCSGTVLREVDLRETVLGIDLQDIDGTVLHLGGAMHYSPGPGLHKQFYGNETEDRIVSAFYLRIFPIPPNRLNLSWTFFSREELKHRVALLQEFTSSWERLDCVLPKNNQEKAFILAQISGLRQEMDLFSLHCPAFIEARKGDKGVHIVNYLRGKRFTVQSMNGSDPFEDDSDALYIWYRFIPKNGFRFF